VGITASNVVEVRLIEEAAAAGFIITQGTEAASHPGMFHNNCPDRNICLTSLKVDLLECIQVPVVASGGLMSGVDVGRMLGRGAGAAKIGTAFLYCDEAGTSETYRRPLLNKKIRKTRRTSTFSGRRSRGISNLFIELMENKRTLPFPAQNSLTAGILRRAEFVGDGEYVSIWAGSSFERIRVLSAVKLTQEIDKELSSLREELTI